MHKNFKFQFCTGNKNAALLHPHWLCQPYERPKPNLRFSESATDPENQRDGNSSVIEERRIRNALRKETKKLKRMKKQEKYHLCNSCQINRKVMSLFIFVLKYLACKCIFDITIAPFST